MKRLIVVLSALLLSACVTAPPPAPQLLRDDLFPGPYQVATAEEIFAPSEAMKQYVDRELAPNFRARGVYKGLLEALYNKGQLKLEYDAERTRNAREAFEARAGNCLSLVIMTSAIAKHLGLQVSYQDVYNDETWSRHHDTFFTSGHVNVTLGPRPIDFGNRGMQPSWTIDFLPPEDIRGQLFRQIDEATVAAMYMNNRAAESLAEGDLRSAYAWARASVQQKPGFLTAYNTLAVVYLRSGQPDAAEQALIHVLRADPRKTVAIANMVRVLSAQGRQAEADTMSRTLARLDPEPPFHFFDLGVAAMRAGDAATARTWFRKEVLRAPYQHEFHFWLAQAEAALGDTEAARKQLGLALSTSTTRSNQALYAAKLDKLNAAERRLN